ncbi:hypothetical protein [Kitasatospora sp. NPDC056181]|uniref:hypothetical protein n=1 Tax=Kitasatospora sp. NPDC056181 TaxID=3345737 RepID=UPI0035DB541C
MTATLAAALLLAACTSGGPSTDPANSRPRTEIALPANSEAWHATAYPPSTVTLTVGDRLGVSGTPSDLARAWHLTSTADGAVLRRGPDVSYSTCAPDSMGCASGIDQTFIALAPGSTTLTWEFRSVVGCESGAPAGSLYGCNSVTKTIQVTVR